VQAIRAKEPARNIAHRFNCSKQYVYRLAKEAKESVTQSPPGPRPHGFDLELNALHNQIGHDLFQFREIRLNMDVREMAKKLGWSTIKVTRVESGFHNLTLTELEDLSRLLGTTVSDLTKIRTTRIAACPNTNSSEPISS